MSERGYFTEDNDVARAARARQAGKAPAGPVKQGGPVDVVRHLQRTVGNQAVNQLLRQYSGALQREEVQDDENALMARHEGLAPIARMVQREEVQDDDDAVMARHTGLPPIARTLQREAAPDDDEQLMARHEGLGPIMTKAEVGAEGGPISDGLAGRIQAARGSGAALDSGTQSHMEGAFGTSFSDVRVHTDGESDALNQGVSAVAFTTGNDVFFRQGAYSPGSQEGQALLAHELTHVVQQRSMGSTGPMTVGPAGDSYEQEADTVGAAVARSLDTNSLQRHEGEDD